MPHIRMISEMKRPQPASELGYLFKVIVSAYSELERFLTLPDQIGDLVEAKSDGQE